MPGEPRFNRRRNALAAFLAVAGACSAAALQAAPPGAPDFDRDIKPILAENCFACHGFDPKTRQANLRLDTVEGSRAAGASGKQAVVPGSSARSELYDRVRATGARQMPPPATGKKLTAAQVDTLRRWIDAGAAYQVHWAFRTPVRPPVPSLPDGGWARNPIDRFVLQRLRSVGLSPAPEADRSTLIRRLSLDLLGLPPTPSEVEAFAADRRPDAYERLVDRLLASDHYGERMALDWLDLARYADTHGYHIDSHRDMWPWRDWVIRAFNRNLSYDRFLVEQIAGDLLQNPTRDQLVATGFNRNHPINYEGGAIPEEYQTAYVLDRVDTTATAVLGLTMRCGQCHEHKYDPISQEEFYRFYAFFNTIDEQGLDGQRGNAVPFIKAPSPTQETRLKELDAAIAAAEQQLGAVRDRAVPAAVAWRRAAAGDPDRSLLPSPPRWSVDPIALAAASPPGTVTAQSGPAPGAARLAGAHRLDVPGVGPADRDEPFTLSCWVRSGNDETAALLSRMQETPALRGWDLYLDGRKVYIRLVAAWEADAIRVRTRDPIPANEWTHVAAVYDGSSRAAGIHLFVNGKQVPVEATHDALKGSIRTDAPLRLGRRESGALFNGGLAGIRLFDEALDARAAAQLAGADRVRPALTPGVEPAGEQRRALVDFWAAFIDPEGARISSALASLQAEREALDREIPTTMVMKEMATPRPTHILIRGQYDRKGAAVSPGIPAFLPPMPAGAPPDRLGLAQWLVDPANPLTARVAVNRIWQMHFGAGLVRSSENFGTQSEPPTHPELLDWLATEFVRTGWDIKRLHRLIVTSAAYRQSSAADARKLEVDRENRLLSRGPRLRLPAEFIRDQALAVSGLLVRKIGGPSVKPYHPAGLWEELAFGGDFTAQTYVQDHGEALYRRSMYTFWKRTCPPPSLQTFDAPEREFCIVRRSSSNTPLQSLILMNDPTYVEASRKLAERLLTDVAATPADRIRYAYRLALGRQPRSEELHTLLGVLESGRAAYRNNPGEAKKLLSVGESPANPALDPIELAAWSQLASVLLGTDEFITRN